jgi:hypothetical protein
MLHNMQGPVFQFPCLSRPKQQASRQRAHCYRAAAAAAAGIALQEGKAKDAAERAAAAEAARRLQEQLAAQVAEREAGEAREQREEVDYFHQEQVGGGNKRQLCAPCATICADQLALEPGWVAAANPAGGACGPPSSIAPRQTVPSWRAACSPATRPPARATPQERMKQWQAEEEEKRRVAREVAERLKEDRAAQLADRDARRRMVRGRAGGGAAAARGKPEHARGSCGGQLTRRCRFAPGGAGPSRVKTRAAGGESSASARFNPGHDRQAADRRAAEEAELAARLAAEARGEFEREEAARKEAKEALKAFLLKCGWAPGP